MKNNFSLNVEQDNDGVIISVSQDLSKYTNQTEIAKHKCNFMNKGVALLEQYAEVEIISILAKYSIPLRSKSIKDIAVALNTLESRYGKKIKIIDLYDNVEENVIAKFEDKTIILDQYNVIQIAIKIVLD